MGREVRRVPADWIHPVDKDGHSVPLLSDYDAALAEYLSNPEWHEAPPREEDYMPSWLPSERTHYQMYETCSEGTPISPVMDSPEALACWLADTGASAFGSMTASYEHWLEVCRSGFAVSAVYQNGTLMSGVEAAGIHAEEKR